MCLTNQAAVQQVLGACESLVQVMVSGLERMGRSTAAVRRAAAITDVCERYEQIALIISSLEREYGNNLMLAGWFGEVKSALEGRQSPTLYFHQMTYLAPMAVSCGTRILVYQEHAGYFVTATFI